MSEAVSPRARVLYIDDDTGFCRLVTRGLGRLGFEVVTADDPVAAVAHAREGRFDVIAVDHYMPGQSGLATLEQIRALESPPPVVYVTGSDEIQIAVAALKAGAADYVLKTGLDDFPALLATSLDQALAQVSLRREKEAAETELRQAKARLEAIVSRQAALLREVNHRVANSLQLVASLVHMQARAVGDEAAREALRDTQARIQAIMQIHRRLYTSEDVQFVEMDEYLHGLVGELETSLSAAAAEHPIRVEAEPIRLQTDKAVSLAVVVTELVTNALKYAYAPGAPGEVRVKLDRPAAGRVRLVVEDDGSGMPAGRAPRGTGLGQTVMAAMADSLDSQLVLDPGHRGVRAVLSFAG